MKKIQLCPICKEKVRQDNRYTNYVCDICRTTHRNLEINGRIANMEVLSTLILYYDKVECTIKNIPCIAKEAHFGGIVILTKI